MRTREETCDDATEAARQHRQHPWTVSAVLSGLIAGLVFGAFWGAVAHALTGGRRDFASIRGIQAARYEVMVNEPDAEAATRILTGTTTAGATDAPPARDDRL